MLSPASAHAYAGGTAPSVQPGTLPPESLATESPSGIREDPLYSPGPAVVIGLSAEVKGQLDRWFGPEPEDDDGILPEEVVAAAEDPFHQKEGSQNGEPSVEEQQVIGEMAARDAQVRAHENAHVSAGAGLTGAISYSYQTGPDGKRYAVGGSVRIDMSPERTPQETLRKAERIRAAALAPADPSPQDASVASRASQMAADARSQIIEEKQAEVQERTEEIQEGRTNPWNRVSTGSEEPMRPGKTLDTIA